MINQHFFPLITAFLFAWSESRSKKEKKWGRGALRVVEIPGYSSPGIDSIAYTPDQHTQGVTVQRLEPFRKSVWKKKKKKKIQDKTRLWKGQLVW